MFPLGSPCLPGEILPLRIFEDRYVRWLDELLDSEQMDFGVVMIDRGREVGGGDIRRSVGTSMSLLRVERLPEGHSFVIAMGRQRLRVLDWLEDDPYPRAVVASYPDVHLTASARIDLESKIAQLPHLNQALNDDGFLARMPVSLRIEEQIYAVAGSLPINSLDRQSILEAPSWLERVAILEDTLQHIEDLMRFSES